MKNDSYTEAISILATMTILFLIGYAFGLTQSPLFLMLEGIMSMGYTMVLLGIGKIKKTTKDKCYIAVGFILMIFSIISILSTPHTSSLFF